MEIIHVVNIQCRFIFVGLLYPRKYFNMNLFQQKHLPITIVHVLLISRMNISLYSSHYLTICNVATVLLYCSNYTVL